MTRSQFDQETWIEAQFPADYMGWGIDVGANDGRFFSNSLMLEEKGWSWICVEADPRYMQALMTCRASVLSCAIMGTGGAWATFYAGQAPTPSEQSLTKRIDGALEIRVPTATIDMILHMVNFPKLDVLTMDIEGGELDALKGFDLAKWHPKVMLIEDQHGPDKLTELLMPHGYRFVKSWEVDHGFVHA